MDEPDKDIDIDIDEVFAAGVARGEFATVAEARRDFDAKMDAAIAELDAGLGTDADVVFARLQERYANWPRAAE